MVAEVSIEPLSKPKTRNTERGNAVSSSDWLAVALKEHCHNANGFDIAKFERVLKENDIEWNINRKTHGWIGRFRMNGNQKLAAVARKPIGLSARDFEILSDTEANRCCYSALTGR